MHQQLFDKRLQALGQLGKEHTEVFQHLLPRQRFTRLFDANARTVDQVQFGALTQQVVQVQIFLPQALEMHLANGCQRLAQYRHLLVRQYRQRRHRSPGIAQAVGTFKKLEQQPAALAFLQAIGQQLRGGQPLLCQQAHTIQLTLKVTRRLAAHHQFGQYGTPAPYPGADITLPRQYSQQGQQLQLRRTGGVGQFDTQRQARRTAGLLQFGQTHQRDPF